MANRAHPKRSPVSKAQIGPLKVESPAPVGEVVAATVIGALVLYGGYKLLERAFPPSPEELATRKWIAEMKRETAALEAYAAQLRAQAAAIEASYGAQPLSAWHQVA